MNNKIKVLYVEDESDVRKNLASILEDEGFEVLQAENGNRGLEIFLETNPDIIISDIIMPEVDGYDLLKSIRDNENINNNDVPFIFISALGGKGDILKGIDLQASDYLVKPIDFDLLIAKIKEKVNSYKKSAQDDKKNIANLKHQISNIVPPEMLQYIDLISKVSGALKSEIYGPLPHKKYLDDLNRIYLHSIKLKAVVNNFLSGELISNQINVKDHIVSPLKFIQNFVDHINDKFRSKVLIDRLFPRSVIPNIRIDKGVLSEVVRKIIGSMLKIDNNININISIYCDHLDRLAIIFCVEKIIDEKILQAKIDKSILQTTLASQGLLIDILVSSDKTRVILFIPNYRVIKKSDS
jgi:CheY-like chemotaxis protein